MSTDSIELERENMGFGIEVSRHQGQSEQVIVVSDPRMMYSGRRYRNDWTGCAATKSRSMAREDVFVYLVAQLDWETKKWGG